MSSASVIALLLIGATTPSYTYREAVLEVTIAPIREGGALTIAWRKIDQLGRAQGHWTRRSLDKVTENRLAIDVGTAGGHEITLSSDGGTHRIWATRGTWYALPRENVLALGYTPTSEGRSLGSSRDITLAGAFSVKVNAVRTRGYLEIGRTLGMDLGAAIRPPEDAALVIVGGGTQQGVVVTLTERRAKDQVFYWDYALNMEPKARRHVIPLGSFVRRDRKSGALKRIEAITIRTVHQPADSDALFIDELALIESPPRIASIKRRKNLLEVVLRGRSVPGARLIAIGGDAKTTTAVTHKTMRLAGDSYANARAICMCYPEEEIEVCDPPDAPTMMHRLPIVPPEPLLIDDFPGAIMVNALRLRTEVYTSTIGLDPTLVMLRKPGSIRLGGVEERHLAYVGYRTPIPRVLPQHLSDLAISLRGRADPKRIKVGLRDLARNEPKISLETYLPRMITSDQTVQIPLIAFGKKARKNLDAITVTLEASDTEKQQLEILRIELR